jgi:hypothetical protein
MKRLLTKMQIPHGGWWFGKHRENTFDELVSVVTKYRQSNGIPIGNIQAEIEEEICKRFPRGCRESKPAPLNTSMATKFIQLMYRFKAKGSKLVDPTEAERRAAICAICPENKPEDEARAATKCTTCAKKLLERGASLGVSMVRSQILKGKVTSKESELKACAVCGCDNRLSVWIPMDVLKVSETDKIQFPNACWKK